MYYGTAARKTKVHADPQCRGLKRAYLPVIEVAPVGRYWCKVCLPGMRANHAFCTPCGSSRPCPHNGGVLAITNDGARWKWPELADERTLVNPVVLR